MEIGKNITIMKYSRVTCCIVCITCVFIVFGGFSERLHCILASLYSSPYKDEYREAKTHYNRTDTPPNAIKTQVIHTIKNTNRSFFPSSWLLVEEPALPSWQLSNRRPVTLVVPSSSHLPVVIIHSHPTQNSVLCLPASSSTVSCFYLYLTQFFISYL